MRPPKKAHKARASAALTAEQREILEKRGVLSPQEIHKLASKTRKAVAADSQKAACHSDHVDADVARHIQDEALPVIFTLRETLPVSVPLAMALVKATVPPLAAERTAPPLRKMAPL